MSSMTNSSTSGYRMTFSGSTGPPRRWERVISAVSSPSRDTPSTTSVNWTEEEVESGPIVMATLLMKKSVVSSAEEAEISQQISRTTKPNFTQLPL